MALHTLHQTDPADEWRGLFPGQPAGTPHDGALRADVFCPVRLQGLMPDKLVIYAVSQIKR